LLVFIKTQQINNYIYVLVHKNLILHAKLNPMFMFFRIGKMR